MILNGLTEKEVEENRLKYGKNILTKATKETTV